MCGQLAIGLTTTASGNVLVNSRPSVRVHDTGAHTDGCPNGAWEAVEGAPAVPIHRRNAHRLGDEGKHVSGEGHLLEESRNVLGGFHLLDEDNAPLIDTPDVIRAASGQEHRSRTDGRGHTALMFTAKQEELVIEVLDDDDDDDEHRCGS